MSDERQQRPSVRNPFVLYFLIGIILLTAARLLWPEKSPVPGSLATLPAWELIDQDGNRFGSGDLHLHHQFLLHPLQDDLPHTDPVDAVSRGKSDEGRDRHRHGEAGQHLGGPGA